MTRLFDIIPPDAHPGAISGSLVWTVGRGSISANTTLTGVRLGSVPLVSEALTLDQILDDAALLSLEHQLHLADLVGDRPWRVNLDEQRFEFVGEPPFVCSRVHLLGSAAPGPRSWLWSWANPYGYSKPVIELAEAVREFGHRHGIGELAAPEVPFDALPFASTEPNAVAGVLLEAAKAVSGVWTAYTGDAGGGTRVAFLIEHPDFRLPPPEAVRVMRVLQQGTAELNLTDHRRAVHSYAVRRGLKSSFNAHQAEVSGPGFDVAIQFDDADRVLKMTARMGSDR